MTTMAPDLVTMRESVDLALIEMPTRPAPTVQELTALDGALRGHIQLLVPEVEALAGPRRDADARLALACTGEARRRLSIGTGDTVVLRVSVVQKLARIVRALCAHFEKLGGTA